MAIIVTVVYYQNFPSQKISFDLYPYKNSFFRENMMNNKRMYVSFAKKCQGHRSIGK